MKLGLALDWSGTRASVNVDRVQLAERLGYDSVWSAEAYGTDSVTPLAYLAGLTKKIKLGTAIMQVSARAPTCAAMTAATLDGLAGDGRMIVGLGLSGPQVVEGWYGQPWAAPMARMRDYVTIMRKVLRRDGPVIHAGSSYRLPYDGPGSRGLGKPLKSIVHCNANIPIWLGTGSQPMVTLTAEIADGWLPFGFVPGSMDIYRPWLEAGFAKAGSNKGFHNFEIQAGVQLNLTDDVESALNALKAMVAMYVGGMGHKEVNFHKDAMVRRGFAEEAERIQTLFLEGHRGEAAALVPDEYVDAGALIGPRARIAAKLKEWQGSGATGLTLYGGSDEALALVADLVGAPRE